MTEKIEAKEKTLGQAKRRYIVSATDMIKHYMKKRSLFVSIALIMLVLLLTGCAGAQKLPMKAEIPADPQNPAWWSTEKCDAQAARTTDEIAKLSQAIIGTEEAGMARPDKLADLDPRVVSEWIESTSFPGKEYLNGVPITEDDKARILDNCNLFELFAKSSCVDVRYAVATENASVRTFPTGDRLSNETGRHDYLQETGLYLGEPVTVIWTSADGEWFYAQACNYRGWINKKSIGFCEEEFFKKYCEFYFDGITPDAADTADGKPVKRAVALRSKEIAVGTAKQHNQWIRMGTVLPMNEDSLIIFARDDEGRLMSETAAPDSQDVIPIGDLEFSEKNIVMLAGRLLGTPYSWGDENERGMDCSSTMASVMRCFGIFIPRNTGDQKKMPVETVDLADMDSAAKREVVSKLEPGTLLYFPGHVMMYLGEHDGELYILHNTTSTELDDGTKEFYSCVITPISTGKTGNTYLDRMDKAVKIVK